MTQPKRKIRSKLPASSLLSIYRLRAKYFDQIHDHYLKIAVLRRKLEIIEEGLRGKRKKP